MIILLQSVATQFCSVFWNISYFKAQQSYFITKSDMLLLQSALGIMKCDRLLVIAKCARYYKVWQTLLQNVSGITKCDSYYKVRSNTDNKIWTKQNGTHMLQRDLTTKIATNLNS